MTPLSKYRFEEKLEKNEFLRFRKFFSVFDFTMSHSRQNSQFEELSNLYFSLSSYEQEEGSKKGLQVAF